jgi:hypothetical protein
MISILEQKRLKAELLRVQAAKAEMEYIIAQRMDEIARLQDNITKQETAEAALIAKIEG